VVRFGSGHVGLAHLDARIIIKHHRQHRGAVLQTTSGCRVFYLKSFARDPCHSSNSFKWPVPSKHLASLPEERLHASSCSLNLPARAIPPRSRLQLACRAEQYSRKPSTARNRTMKFRCSKDPNGACTSASRTTRRCAESLSIDSLKINKQTPNPSSLAVLALLKKKSNSEKREKKSTIFYCGHSATSIAASFQRAPPSIRNRQ
jgi:hypothetical protein